MSARPYKKPWSPEKVEEFLHDKFDPDQVKAAIQIRAGIAF